MRLLAAALALFAAAASAQDGGGIGYPTVDAALQALRARGDATISVQNGWTIVDDRGSGALWSFTPPGHPAHPAAVKRTIVSRDGAMFVQMAALCQADKAACDRLIAQFKELNERMTAELRAKAQAQGPASRIDVQRLGDDSFVLALKSFRSQSVEAGQAELWSKAAELCGEKRVGYGRYEFETIESLSPGGEKRPLLLKQNITCGGPAGPRPPTVAATNRDASWRPSAQQVQLVERLTHAYFAAKDAGKYDEAHGYFSAGQKQTVPLEGWRSTAGEVNSRLGAAQGRSIRKITWYKDPPNALPGIYAAVDFSSRFANTTLHCGYVVWQQQVDDGFLLIREEQNFVGINEKMQQADLERFRARWCR